MSSEQYSGELAFALDLAQRAGDILTNIRERGLDPESTRTKLGHYDIVTEGDMASERFILSELKSAYPGYGIMSEETSQRFSDAEWVWIVDPVDGTTNYSHGLPIYAVNIALAHNGYPVLGVTHDPENSRTYWAVRGGGAWVRTSAQKGNRESRLHVSEVNELQQSVLATGFRSSHIAADGARYTEFAILDFQTQSVRRLGSAALNIAWVAAGHMEAYWESGLKPWDFAPGWVIIDEAGGHLIDYEGNPAQLTMKTHIISNGQPAIDNAIMQTVREVAGGIAAGNAGAGLGERTERPEQD